MLARGSSGRAVCSKPTLGRVGKRLRERGECMWVRVRPAACTYLGSSCRDTWHGRGHPWTAEGRPPLIDLARLSAVPLLMIILFPALTKYFATDPHRRCTLCAQTGPGFCGYHGLSFKKITTGRFEKSVRGLERLLCLHGRFQGRHGNRVQILMAFVTYVSYSHINTCLVYIVIY